MNIFWILPLMHYTVSFSVGHSFAKATWGCGCQGIHTVHDWLVMSKKLLIFNPQWPLQVNAEESPAAANLAFCCYFPCYWGFRLLPSKLCGWLLIKTLESASSMTDRNAIQQKNQGILCPTSPTPLKTKPSAVTLNTSFRWILKPTYG